MATNIESDIDHEGYNYDFVDKIHSSQYCAICLMVVKDASTITSCGHAFCKKCIGNWIRKLGNEPIRCPVDNVIVKREDIVEDKRLKREILSQQIYCENRKKGCKLTPELGDYEKHRVECEYTLVSCPFNCGQLVTLNGINLHIEICPNHLLTCNWCEQLFKLSTFAVHDTDEVCPVQEIPFNVNKFEVVTHIEQPSQQRSSLNSATICILAPIGCNEKWRRDLKSELVIRVDEYVNATVNKQQGASSNPRPRGPEHEGITCDNCRNSIVGVRYKCGYCPNFDLCEVCECLEDIHYAEHVFLKIKRPCLRHMNRVSGVFQPLLRHRLYNKN